MTDTQKVDEMIEGFKGKDLVSIIAKSTEYYVSSAILSDDKNFCDELLEILKGKSSNITLCGMDTKGKYHMVGTDKAELKEIFKDLVDKNSVPMRFDQ